MSKSIKDEHKPQEPVVVVPVIPVPEETEQVKERMARPPVDVDTLPVLTDVVLDTNTSERPAELAAEGQAAVAAKPSRTRVSAKARGLLGKAFGKFQRGPKPPIAPNVVTAALPSAEVSGVDQLASIFAVAEGKSTATSGMGAASAPSLGTGEGLALRALELAVEQATPEVRNEAEIAAKPDVPDDVVEAAKSLAVEVEQEAPKQGFLRKVFGKKAASEHDAGKESIPISILFGYLPDVREQDAVEYALGYAAEFMQLHGMVYFEAFPYRQGYAFEVQQGGNGRAFLPEVLKYFNSKGDFVPGENVSVVIHTATRQAEVYRTRDGLDFVLLPEGTTKEITEWLKPTSAMTPAINRKTGFFVVGAVMFATGFAAMMVSSMLTRFQEFEPAPPVQVEYVKLADTPSGQLSKLSNVPENSYVKALRYKNGAWEQPEFALDVEMVRLQQEANRQAEMAANPPVEPTPATQPNPVETTPVTGGAN